MKKDQEARILSNQVLILRALQLLMSDGIGGGYMRQELARRANETETFIRDYLK